MMVPAVQMPPSPESARLRRLTAASVA